MLFTLVIVCVVVCFVCVVLGWVLFILCDGCLLVYYLFAGVFCKFELLFGVCIYISCTFCGLNVCLD